MKTFNTRPKEVQTNKVKNYNQFKNNFSFTGMKEDTNIFDVDQNSFADCLNIYINGDRNLISREPLTLETLPAVVMAAAPLSDWSLIDTVAYKGGDGIPLTIYVFKDNNGLVNYQIIAYKNGTIKTLSLTAATYKLTNIENLIICFNSLGAKVLDIDSFNAGWVNISNYSEIPVTKVTTGSSTITVNETNKFTNKYKQQYVISNTVNTLLPETPSTASDIEFIKSGSTDKLTNFNNPNILTNYRAVKRLDSISNIRFGKLSAGDNIVAIGRDTHFIYSLNYGNSWTQVDYPRPSYIPQIQTLSDDGKAFFCVYENNYVYKYSIATNTWYTIKVNNTDTLPYTYWITPLYHFLNENNFAFIAANGIDKYRVYYLSPYVASGQLSYQELNDNFGSIFNVINSGGIEQILHKQLRVKVHENNFVIVYYRSERISNYYNYYCGIIVGNSNGVSTNISTTPINSENLINAGIAIDNITISNILDYNDYSLTINGVVTDTYPTVYKYTITADANTITTPTKALINSPYVRELPILLDDNLYFDTEASTVYGVGLYTNDFTVNESIAVVNGIVPNDISNIAYDKVTKTIYVCSRNNNYNITNLYTNHINDGESIVFTYTYTGTGTYTTVPDIVYSGSELYLAIGNKLQITQNYKNGSDFKLYLGDITTQSFGHNITGLINISTTELAIFFETGIVVCSKIANDNFKTGYAYTYDKTRLTLGTKFGNSVINTLDGAATMFATPRGLAIMSYQAYMATTDQTLDFITDPITVLWNEFYKQSSNITCLQFKEYLFVYNTTGNYLMFDFRSYSWWRFEVPYNITKLVTDQMSLYLISKRLLLFNREYDRHHYFDYYVHNGSTESRINWMMKSQRLHFEAPSHYKNIKQIIFQLMQSSKNEMLVDNEELGVNNQNSVLAQIKLYRKVVDYREPEIISFTVDEFRTFVKRFNYWKINELQWGLANDTTAAVPQQLLLNGVTVKYEIGEEVR